MAPPTHSSGQPSPSYPAGDTMLERQAILGIVFVATAASLYSLGAVLTKSLLEEFSVVEMALARTISTCVFLLIIVAVYYRAHLKLSLREVPLAIAYGTVAMVLSPFMFFSAIERVSVGIVLIIGYSAPLLIILWLLGALAFKVTGAVIHLLLILALVAVIVHFLRRSRV